MACGLNHISLMFVCLISCSLIGRYFIGPWLFYHVGKLPKLPKTYRLLHREMKNAADMYISLLLTLYLDNSIMAYTIHGHISYRPILRGLLGKEKELENKVKLC